MQDETIDQNDPDIARPEDRALEPRTTASPGQPCERCSRPLNGRKQRFCSDKCRMKAHRQQQAARVTSLINAIEESAKALKAELEAHHEG